jgi:hypothetical protein
VTNQALALACRFFSRAKMDAKVQALRDTAGEEERQEEE